VRKGANIYKQETLVYRNPDLAS